MKTPTNVFNTDFFLDVSCEKFMDNVLPTVRTMAKYNGKDYTSRWL